MNAQRIYTSNVSAMPTVPAGGKNELSLESMMEIHYEKSSDVFSSFQTFKASLCIDLSKSHFQSFFPGRLTSLPLASSSLEDCPPALLKEDE